MHQNMQNIDTLVARYDLAIRNYNTLRALTEDKAKRTKHRKSRHKWMEIFIHSCFQRCTVHSKGLFFSFHL